MQYRLQSTYLRKIYWAKQVKAGSRKKKMELIERINPEWRDLSELLKTNPGEELIRIKKLFK